MKIHLRSHLFIPVELFTEALRQKLTIVNKNYGKSTYTNAMEEEPYFILYAKVKSAQGKEFYRIPRYALGELSKLPLVEEVPDHPEKIVWKPKDKNFALNEEQVKSISRVYDTLMDKKGCNLIGSPGEGKTSMAINIICKIGQRTLVLVHKDSLMNQWKEELLALTDLKEDDIGFLQRGKYKKGRVVIGSQASLMRLSIGREINEEFGFVIQDEEHHASANMFLKAFTRFNAQYRLGLSATPNRDDGMEQLFFLHISNNMVKHTSVRNVPSKVLLYNYSRTKAVKYFSFLPFRESMIRNIIDDEERNALLLKIIQEHSDRNIVVLGERIKHLRFLMERTQLLFPEKKIVRFFGGEVTTVWVKDEVTGKSKRKKVKEKYSDPPKSELRSANMIFATYKKMVDGENIPHLNGMLYATPFAGILRLEQSKGRQERLVDGKDENNRPLLIDIVDDEMSFFMGMAQKRIKQYRKWGMEIMEKRV